MWRPRDGSPSNRSPPDTGLPTPHRVFDEAVVKRIDRGDGGAPGEPGVWRRCSPPPEQLSVLGKETNR